MSGLNKSSDQRNRRKMKMKNRERGKFRKTGYTPFKRGWAVLGASSASNRLMKRSGKKKESAKKLGKLGSGLSRSV